jgi:hypothetical protein
MGPTAAAAAAGRPPATVTAAAAAAGDDDGFRVPLCFSVAIAGLTVAGKAGDALAPTLLGSSPLILLALNSNDLHLALTTPSVSLLPWLVVGMLRRLAEDPIFFLLGERGLPTHSRRRRRHRRHHQLNEQRIMLLVCALGIACFLQGGGTGTMPRGG